MLIQFDCPQNLETFVEFYCNVTMLQYPRPGFSNHNVTITVGTNPPAYINTFFNSTTQLVLLRIDSFGTFNLNAKEMNYNMSVAISRTVNKSKIFNKI